MSCKLLLSLVIAASTGVPTLAQQVLDGDRPAKGVFDERGPARSKPAVGVRRPSSGTIHDSTFTPHVTRPLSLGGVRMSPYKKAYPSGRLYMYRSPRWTTRKIFPDGFARIMPYGLPDIPLDAVGQVKSTLAILDNPRRFLRDEPPAPSEAPLRVLRSPNRFEPELVRAMIVTQDRAQLQGVATAADQTRRIERTRNQSIEAKEEYRLRRLNQSASPFQTSARGPHSVIGTGAAYDPQLHPQPVDDERPAFDPSVIGTEPTDAISQLRAEIKNAPGDYHLLRLLAIAHLVRREMPEATALIARAYDADPLLVSNPLDLISLGLEPGRVTSLVTAAQAYAVNGGSNAHLLAVVLQQAQGTVPQAKASLARARKAGISPELADLFTASLK